MMDFQMLCPVDKWIPMLMRMYVAIVQYLHGIHAQMYSCARTHTHTHTHTHVHTRDACSEVNFYSQLNQLALVFAFLE